MKLLVVLASLIVAVQAISIGLPASGSFLQSGQTFSVQIIEGIDTSAEAGVEEISLVIGIVPCGSSDCPAPSSNMGQILFIGKYQSQGVIPNTLTTFENFNFTVPSDVSGASSIQVQHAYLFTLPGPDSEPEVEYASVAVYVTPSLNIHPSGASSKCVGILGGVYADGTAVDIYDCNGSDNQIWQWNGNALTSVNPADGSQWCLDAGVSSTWANGLKMKIWECLSVPQQTWTPVTTSGTIKLTTGNFCLDLTNGITTDENVLQIWTCVAGNANQLWTVTAA